MNFHLVALVPILLGLLIMFAFFGLSPKYIVFYFPSTITIFSLKLCKQPRNIILIRLLYLI